MAAIQWVHALESLLLLPDHIATGEEHFDHSSSGSEPYPTLLSRVRLNLAPKSASTLSLNTKTP